jgi:exodeoxyribonuclease V beta subunit
MRCAARFGRDLDLRWRRTSYSDITAGSYEHGVGSEAEEPLIGDEPDEEAPTPVSVDVEVSAELAAASPMGGLPFGTQVGTFVHNVMEACDFAAGDVGAELDRAIAAVGAIRGTEAGDPAILRDGLRGVLETPFLGEVRLRDIARGDRLDELAFELPLAGGDDARGWVTLDAIASVLRSFVPSSDPVAGYAERLADPALRGQVRGYLTGSLDLVARLDGGGRFVVCDYKTNWLGTADEPLTLWHYRPAALAVAMQRHHYVLQALLYLVALHRFLRWRLPAYDPDRQLAGAVYLFLRGMAGPATPAGCGVFAWSPPPGLVAALSDALDEGVRA